MKVQVNHSEISGQYHADADSEQFYFDYDKSMGVYNLSYYQNSETINCLVYVDVKKLNEEQPEVYAKLIGKIDEKVESYIEENEARQGYQYKTSNLRFNESRIN